MSFSQSCVSGAVRALNAGGKVFGYELLYRAAQTDTSCTAEGDLASARVLTDAVLEVGLDTLTNGRPAFLNLTKPLITSQVATLLPHAAAVYELREDVEVDDEVIEACRNLHKLGYRLALDDFEVGSGAEQLLPLAQNRLQAPPGFFENKEAAVLPAVGAALGIAGAIAGNTAATATGAGVAVANPTYENTVARRTGSVAMDLKIVNPSGGRILGTVVANGSFTSESAASGFSLFGIGKASNAFAASALGQANRAAMNSATTQIMDRLRSVR